MIKYLPAIVVSSVLLGACSQGAKEAVVSTDLLNKDSLRTVLINIDKGWSDLSQKKGFYKSRLEFLTENSIDLTDGKMPIEGKKAIEVYVLTHKDTTANVVWKPLRAEVAASGEIGYTFGGWTMKTANKFGNDTTIYGSYITIWHKQPDGSWKYVIDGGNSTPAQVNQ
jgi:ketosteroid isomerase-like protein